ncbi:hypothetical protein PVT71_28215 (plasmid) [Salipiger sp. H15]|uniref:Uncharacterized protein n=1 Tax=Alloyangia sp. H15 TaxID=3029062 RepID=A0AAU8AS03_9RHOB
MTSLNPVHNRSAARSSVEALRAAAADPAVERRKSVTALSVMGLLPEGLARASGSVQFEGKELLDLPERQMERIRGNDIAMIFHTRTRCRAACCSG